MFNLINNWKILSVSIILIASLTLNSLQYFQIDRAEKKAEKCNYALASREAADNIAMGLRNEQEKKLRLREQEAAHAQAESLKRMEYINKQEIKGGCEGAIKFLIDYRDFK